MLRIFHCYRQKFAQFVKRGKEGYKKEMLRDVVWVKIELRRSILMYHNYIYTPGLSFV